MPKHNTGDLRSRGELRFVIILIASQHLCSAITVPMLGEPHNRDSISVFFYAPEEMKKDLQVLLQTVWNEIILPIVIVISN